MSLFSLSHFFTGLFWAMAMWTVDKGWIAFIRQFLGSFNWMIAFGGSQISSPNHCNLYHNWHTIGGMSWRSAALDHWFKSVLRFIKNAFPVRTIRKQINSKSELFWREEKFVFFLVAPANALCIHGNDATKLSETTGQKMLSTTKSTRENIRAVVKWILWWVCVPAAHMLVSLHFD